MAGIVDDVLKQPILQPHFEAEKITARYLAKKLKRELLAKETKFFQHKVRLLKPEKLLTGTLGKKLGKMPIGSLAIILLKRKKSAVKREAR